MPRKFRECWPPRVRSGSGTFLGILGGPSLGLCLPPPRGTVEFVLRRGSPESRLNCRAPLRRNSENFLPVIDHQDRQLTNAGSVHVQSSPLRSSGTCATMFWPRRSADKTDEGNNSRNFPRGLQADFHAFSFADWPSTLTQPREYWGMTSSPHRNLASRSGLFVRLPKLLVSWLGMTPTVMRNSLTLAVAAPTPGSTRQSVVKWRLKAREVGVN